MVTVGQKAPDFAATALRYGDGVVLELFEIVRAHDAVVLYFYPADFVAECTAELVAIRDAGWDEHDDIAVVGLSGDSLFSHAAYAREHTLPFPLVSDFHGHVAESYDLVVQEWEGHNHLPKRAAVVVSGDWDVLGIEQADPLTWADPAPVEAIITAVQSAGVDIEKPDVDYE